jgi:hypothetical protein
VYIRVRSPGLPSIVVSIQERRNEPRGRHWLEGIVGVGAVRESAEGGVDHLLVALDGGQQRDVDVDAAAFSARNRVSTATTPRETLRLNLRSRLLSFNRRGVAVHRSRDERIGVEKLACDVEADDARRGLRSGGRSRRALPTRPRSARASSVLHAGLLVSG